MTVPGGLVARAFRDAEKHAQACDCLLGRKI